MSSDSSTSSMGLLFIIHEPCDWHCTAIHENLVRLPPLELCTMSFFYHLDPPISKVCAIKLLDPDAFTFYLVITSTQTKTLIPVVGNIANIPRIHGSENLEKNTPIKNTLHNTKNLRGSETWLHPPETIGRKFHYNKEITMFGLKTLSLSPKPKYTQVHSFT